ncbi:hypothetical protein JL193_09310 [Polaribacter batillariae]|uniref:Uncharacterized protein n=1 Tax=Polaribacter batillariae TaxID=2808900 RepID=A0ABX7SSP5_9FLAO|nr:hypothetical protein [Polaribacter batillariae]QTD36360.1 hypothetical protein JL193_09310 [Polaribacter batillariae]
MKPLYTVAFVLFISASLSSKITINNSLTATFKGVTDNDYFKFEDDNKKEVLFYDVAEDVEITLYDDDLIGKKFKITWIEKEVEEMDENGEETGEKKTVKSITALSYAK